MRGKIRTVTERGGVLKTAIARGVYRMIGGGHDDIEKDVMLQKKGSITIVRNIVGESRKARKKITTITVTRDNVTKRMTTQQSARDIETRYVNNTKMKATQRTMQTIIKDMVVLMRNAWKRRADRGIHDVITTERTATQVEHQIQKVIKSITGESHDTQTKRVITNTNTSPRNVDHEELDRSEKQEVSFTAGKSPQ